MSIILLELKGFLFNIINNEIEVGRSIFNFKMIKEIMTILIPIAETRTKAISNIMSPQTICLTNIKSKGVYYLIR